MRLAILIPAFNEEKTIGAVLKSLPKTLPQVTEIEVVVVSDGSRDQTVNIAKKFGATVIEHDLNRGLGGALGTGFEYAKMNDFDCLLTFDADGQHSHRDIWPVLRPIVYKKADVSIGSRLKDHKGMPWYRVMGIWGLNIITYLFFWVWTTDSQSGLRAFSKKAIHAINIQANRMEVSSEFFYEAGKKDLKITEVQIESIYTQYSLNKGIGKGQFRHGFRILAKMAYRRLFSK